MKRAICVTIVLVLALAHLAPPIRTLLQSADFRIVEPFVAAFVSHRSMGLMIAIGTAVIWVVNTKAVATSTRGVRAMINQRSVCLSITTTRRPAIHMTPQASGGNVTATNRTLVQNLGRPPHRRSFFLVKVACTGRTKNDRHGVSLKGSSRNC